MPKYQVNGPTVVKHNGEKLRRGSTLELSKKEAAPLLGLKTITPVKESGGKKNTPEWPKHTGGGWYELSNGEKVQGKEEAEEAQEAIDNPKPPETEWPKNLGDGVYELSNGEKVEGKDEAEQAQKELDGQSND